MASDISSLLVEGRPGASAAKTARREAETAEFAQAVLMGLARRPRSIPSRFLYDAVGSALFEEITKLKEYYPTRVETKLLQDRGAEIARLVGDADILVEFGSGSSRKTSLLIGALEDLHTYIPIDVSESFLAEAAKWLATQHDGLRIKPVIADFTTTRALAGAPRGQKLGFFSGSTIGNLTHDEAKVFLANAAQLLGEGSAFLIGVDLKKSLDILIPAYDDDEGVTASFSLNMLARINRELDGDFDILRFAHRALYNAREGRVEIYLESLTDQTVRVLGRRFAFAEGERIHTENSHKYTLPEFQSLASAAGWRAIEAWTDDDDLFSLHLLRCDEVRG
jgi:L-histidine N-alpha-methyltransferase